MSFKPRTSSEINLFNIEKTLKKINNGKMTLNEASEDLNWRFGRLKTDNIGMYEELYPKYITIARLD